ncbi:MAG TPA: class I SAM-dependent methyltransferase [Urbifossiella sp.]|jgi:ubiquinone/menaquinone biosynthesis C-methylase UbiE|nr:class I SAM-dependent methyltransferase [Urbifossiella sp.]
MLARVLEPEVMDTPDDARDYDAMDHSAVNAKFAADFLARWGGRGRVLDVGTGTAQIPIELCRRSPTIDVVAVDLADAMIALARRNVERAGFAARVRVERVDAKGLPYLPGAFGAVVSNSIIHHIPEPAGAFAGMHAVCAEGGRLFVRDLFRPPDENTLRLLVATYAAGCNPHQTQLFADSLRAALTVAEVRELVGRLGYAPDTVQATSDRHWTFAAVRRPG